MPTWDASQYLRFNAERSRPCRDLVDRISLENPVRIIDLGCGPGNSTAFLAARWRAAKMTGLDRSPDMIAEALALPFAANVHWRAEDISTWAQGNEQFDLVFSNAALQWVPNHAQLFPRLFAHVTPGGALAMQVPINMDAPAHCLMRELAKAPKWVNKFPQAGVREWHVHSPAFYYDLLAAQTASMDIWQTEYIHVLASPEAIVEWYKGTGLRPFLDALDGPVAQPPSAVETSDHSRGRLSHRSADSDRAAFLADYLDLIRDAYPRSADGRVLFPFQRLFLIAYSRRP